uniref:Uncharacterized protein n=1 Tax=Solanum lycopersicum TaxID=4081 RepID=A0A3Q7HUE0_SOLLC
MVQLKKRTSPTIFKWALFANVQGPNNPSYMGAHIKAQPVPKNPLGPFELSRTFCKSFFFVPTTLELLTIF